MNPSKPKAADVDPIEVPKAAEKEAVVLAGPAPAEYALILGVRRIKTGSFAGLWELTELDDKHSVKRVLTDANTRSIVINLAAREIGKCL